MTDDCPRDCPMAQKISALEDDNRRHKDTHSKIYDRLSAIEKQNAVQDERYAAIMEKLNRIDAKYDRTADKIESMERTIAKQAQTLDELNERGKSNVARLNALESKPAENWKLLVGAVITGVVGVIIGFIFSGILPS